VTLEATTTLTLTESGRYEGAQEACRKAESQEGLSRFTSEIQSLICEELGNLSEADEVCRRFLTQHPEDAEFLMRHALVLTRMGDDAASSAAFARVPLEKVLHRSDLTLLYSQMLQRTGEHGLALEALYQARQVHRFEPSIHAAYVSAFVQRTADAVAPTKVLIESAVHVVGDGAPGWVLVTASKSANAESGEFSVEHDIGQKLLGQGSADVIELDDGRKWTIDAIQSKHVFAFNQTLKNFGRQFPGNPLIEQREVPEGEGKFKEQLKSRLGSGDRTTERALAEYRAGHFTIGTLAHSLQRSLVETLAWVSQSSCGVLCGVLCASNTAEERQREHECISQEVALILDTTSALSLASLGLLDTSFLERWKVCVVQTTLDDIAKEAGSLRAGPKGDRTLIGVDNGVLTRQTLSEGDRERIAAHYEAIETKLRKVAVVCAVSPAVAEANAVHGDVSDIIGSSSWDAMRAVVGEQRVLVSDDLHLRRLAASMLKVEGVSVSTLLSTRHVDGHLSTEEYSTLMMRLIVSGYRSLPVNVGILSAAAQSDEWSLGSHVQKLLRSLEGPGVEANSAIGVAAEFLKSTWLNSVLPNSRAAILFAVLSALTTARRRASVLRALRAAIEPRFHLLQPQLDEVNAMIEGWERVNIAT